MIKRLSKLAEQVTSTLDRCLGIGARRPNEQACPQSHERYISCSVDASQWASVSNDTICIHDVSGSMTWKDCTPSRLGASKQATETFVRKRASISPDDRVALLTFNDMARVILPLTEIRNINQILFQVSLMLAAGGTDIAEGLKAACHLFRQDTLSHPATNRYRRVLLLTDGRGGRPLKWAQQLKAEGILVEVVGVGGDPSAVDEKLLRKVATTDSEGRVHYRFFRDTESLVSHYEDLATGIVFRGHNK